MSIQCILVTEQKRNQTTLVTCFVHKINKLFGEFREHKISKGKHKKEH